MLSAQCLPAAATMPLVPVFRKAGDGTGPGARWEEAYLDTLHKLRSQGLSFGACAVRMGVTRNSTIGAANRARLRGDMRFPLGETRRGVTAPSPHDHNRKRASRAGEGRRVVVKRSPSPRIDSRVIDLPLFSASARAAAFAPPSRRLMCWEVGPRDCRFIAGSDRTMCGHPVEGGSSWCGFHRPLTLARAA